MDEEEDGFMSTFLWIIGIMFAIIMIYTFGTRT